MQLISVARNFTCRPSELMELDDPYTAYCLDEACSYIVSEMMNGKEPKFEVKFTSLRDMYRHYGA